MLFPIIPSAGVIIFAIIIVTPFFLFYDTRKRGKSFGEGLLWAVGGFLFTIVVLPVWFWIRPKTADEGAGMCPKCKELLVRDPKVCPTCGHVLVGEVVELSMTESEDSLNNSE